MKGKPNGKLGPMNPTNPALYEFLRNLFAEIVQVFPDQYVHLGGDEVPFDCWKSNPEINSYMKSRNMSSYNLLESEYIGRLLRITDSLEANTIVWQEVNRLFFFFFNHVSILLTNKSNGITNPCFIVTSIDKYFHPERGGTCYSIISNDSIFHACD